MNRLKKPKQSQFNVRVTVNELEKLRRKAWDKNTSISDLVRAALMVAKLLQSTEAK